MKDISYLIIGKSGIRGVRKSKPSLRWDEIALKVSLEIPDILFERPALEATIKVDKNIMPEKISPELIINTKKLIEEATGVRIDFRVIAEDKNESLDS